MLDYEALRQRMVDNQIRPSAVTDADVIRAMASVPREVFAAESEKPFAYADRDLIMSHAAPHRRMLQPVQLARLVQALPLGPHAKVLDVGCGSGCSAAVLARLAGSVVALEEDAKLAAMARERLAGLGAANVTVVEGKLVDGVPAESPYDAILVDGAVEVVPESLISQLKKEGGALATIVRSERISRAMVYERVGSKATKWPQFEAWAAGLPGFERKPEFVF
jgi:protein-L-isoaspartate(D-aspartate) O-methyltransferase